MYLEIIRLDARLRFSVTIAIPPRVDRCRSRLLCRQTTRSGGSGVVRAVQVRFTSLPSWTNTSRSPWIFAWNCMFCICISICIPINLGYYNIKVVETTLLWFCVYLALVAPRVSQPRIGYSQVPFIRAWGVGGEKFQAVCVRSLANC